MWNILIVIIIAIIIWAVNPLAHLKSGTPLTGVSQKTKNEVNQVQNEAINQVNQARQLQEEEQKALNNN